MTNSLATPRLPATLTAWSIYLFLLLTRWGAFDARDMSHSHLLPQHPLTQQQITDLKE